MIELEVSPGAQADAAAEEQLVDGHLTVPGGLEWDETPVERHTIANLRYAGGKEHDVRYVSEVHLDAALAREVALREELAKFKAVCVDLSSQVRELEHKMDYYKGEGLRADTLQQRLTVAEQRVETLTAFAQQIARQQGEPYFSKLAKAALKPAAEEGALGARPVGCCCPPIGHAGIWAAAICPVHFGLRRPKPSAEGEGA